MATRKISSVSFLPSLCLWCAGDGGGGVVDGAVDAPVDMGVAEMWADAGAIGDETLVYIFNISYSCKVYNPLLTNNRGTMYYLTLTTRTASPRRVFY